MLNHINHTTHRHRNISLVGFSIFFVVCRVCVCVCVCVCACVCNPCQSGTWVSIVDIDYGIDFVGIKNRMFYINVKERSTIEKITSRTNIVMSRLSNHWNVIEEKKYREIKSSRLKLLWNEKLRVTKHFWFRTYPMDLYLWPT